MRAPVVGLGFLHVGRIAARRHLAEQTKGIDLVAALLVLASQVERLLPSCAASSTRPVESHTSPSGIAPRRWSETNFIEAAWSATLRSRGMASAVRFASAYAAPSDAATPWNDERRQPEGVADLQTLLQHRHGGGGVPLPEVNHPHAHARHDQTERVLARFGPAQRLLRPARCLRELAELGERPRQVGRALRHHRRHGRADMGEPPAASRALRDSRNVAAACR